MIPFIEPRTAQEKGLTIDEDGTLYFRQSYLDTWLTCPERARLALVHPEMGTEGDAAMAGTAAHAAIEAFLNGEIKLDHMAQYAYEWALAACEVHVINWQKFTSPQELAGHASRCAVAWKDGIRPFVPPGGMPEFKFKLPLGEFRGKRYGIKGTIDYVPQGIQDAVDSFVKPDEFFDWKTAGGEYKQWEKQRSAIQPTAYSVALHKLLGWEYPIKMTYGIMVRRQGPAKAQMITVTRMKGHEALLHDIIGRYITMYDLMGLDEPWPIDNSNYLCSEQWCDHWFQCVGSHITTQEHRLPDPYRKD